jgi:hypothetical protein
MNRILWLSGALAVLGACYTDGNSSTVQSGPLTPTGVTAEQRKANEDLKTKLTKNCAGCHSQGANKPFFASIEAFESLFVYNETYIVPGKPESSELIRLLLAQGTLTYKQMPPGGDAFSTLATKGQTDIDVDGVNAFIRALKPRQLRGVKADPEATTLRPMDAWRIRRALTDQLGVDVGAENVPNALTLRSADGPLPLKTPDTYQPDNNGYPVLDDRWKALGGASYLQSTKPNRDMTPSLVLNLNQVAQGWCRVSVKTQGSPLFKFASASDTSASKATEIKKNLGYMMTRMLGIFPTSAQVDALYNGVFLPTEKVSTEAAWTASCAALVRHPLWLSY